MVNLRCLRALNVSVAYWQEFSDVKAFRNAIKDAAIAQHFELLKLPNAPTFAIRSLGGTHTCGINAHTGHHQASVDWIVKFIEEPLRDNINYKPKDILHDVYRQLIWDNYTPYKQAWRDKERGLQAIFGSSEESYCLLPAYCEQIVKINPGSVAEVFTSVANNRFQRVFVSFYASIRGFLNGCLPAVGHGGIQLKRKYLSTLLSATSFDGDGGLFPLAFGVVDMENDEIWMWFLAELHKALEMSMEARPRLTFLSDRHKGVSDAIKRKFPAASNAICM
ncbi:uncharacterized protein [Henckelia pumila]|uniref:uncharacterized protein n=1 Tax=Henckelia pumila TaxID=405737 RepID=UPI003C6DC046